MYGRPDSISAIGYLLVIGGSLGLLAVICSVGLNDFSSDLTPSTIAVDLVVGGVASVICLVCGRYMLKGANWARWLYTVACITLLALDFFMVQDTFYTFAPAAFLYVITILFLFLPKANKFFHCRLHRQFE